MLGVPSSAGSYAPGQEGAPAALRDAGLIHQLREGGRDVRDLGDLPRFRWRPDRAHRRAQNAAAVAAAIRGVSAAVEPVLADGRFALVLGGDCTVGVGTAAASVAAGGTTGLVYFDMHPDLNVPASEPDGALDWMGLAHMLALHGCVPEVCDAGGRSPLLEAAQVVVLGYEESQSTDWEQQMLAGQQIAIVPAREVLADPVAAAMRAVSALPAGTTRILIHLDVDVIDFIDAPLSQNTGRNVGITLDAALAALQALTRDPRASALTVTELNPVHAAADPGCLDRLVAGVVRAL